MKIEILSKKEAIQKSYVIDEDCIIISINDINSERPIFAVNHSIKGVLTLFFDDEEDVINGMKTPQAIRVVYFVNQWKNKVQTIIVHCGAGISRSAGVAAAIGKVLNGDDTFVFNNPKYVPNRNCYRKTLNAFMEV